MIKNIRLGQSFLWKGHIWKATGRIVLPIAHGPADTFITLKRPGLGGETLCLQFMSNPDSTEGQLFARKPSVFRTIRSSVTIPITTSRGPRGSHDPAVVP